MTTYFAIYVAPAVLALLKLWKQGRFGLIAIAVALFLTVFVGYRYYIGVDWITYEIIFLDNARGSLGDTLSYGDSAYSFVNWMVAQFGGQVWHANLICAAIFSFALVIFCKELPRPGLALAIAVPTLIVVTAMGYTRQATAIGCIMLAFSQFRGTVDWRWLCWLSLAILFHRSAIVVLPIFLLAGSRQRWLTIAVGGVVAIFLVFTVVLQNFQDIVSLYFESDIESSGAIPRLAVGTLTGLAYFAVRRKEIFGERRTLVRNTAIAMIVLLPLYAIVPSTTVIDRIGILLLPFQSAILAGLAGSLEDHPVAETVTTLLILALYAVMYAVWLLFATFATYWIPYDNVLLIDWL